MAGEDDTPSDFTCSFCGASKTKRGALVQGGAGGGQPPVHICHGCAVACVRALDDEDSQAVVRDMRTLPLPAALRRTKGDRVEHEQMLRMLNEEAREKRRAAGLPEHVYFHEVLFNPSSGAVVVRCRDRALGHSGGRVYHRLAESDHYVPTFELTEVESVDSVVVALDVPMAVAVVIEWRKHRGTWAGSHHRVVATRLDGAVPNQETVEPPSEVMFDGAPAHWADVSTVASISDDGRVVYCKAVVGAEPGPQMPARFGIFRWELDTGDVTLVAKLPGVYC